jgi:hypothetical protein
VNAMAYPGFPSNCYSDPQYETQMIPKALLQQKLHEWSLMLQASQFDQRR